MATLPSVANLTLERVDHSVSDVPIVSYESRLAEMDSRSDLHRSWLLECNGGGDTGRFAWSVGWNDCHDMRSAV